ncbi:hypothetical protein HZU75_06560 [Chitinibacter fontanus]|uniref:Uncharacterized protein n=1 Tax=Chitinibacter fontanus TaxID=1737446 RepID=A0A7D5V9V6_9NEIS|nr:hypothetical protein [Chitinibacter fontanus]QLI81220.1 hypothetical protein HZU75_06560 [Chitinibacter fontanus]
MIALLCLIFLVGYFWLIFKLTRWFYRSACNKGIPSSLARLLGGLVAVAGLAVVFWDAIPTWYTHYHLCETEAGLKVYQTPDEWMKENPEQFTQVRAAAGREFKDAIRSRDRTATEEISRTELTKDFVYEDRRYLTWNYAFHTRRFNERIVYKPTGKILFENTDFFSASGSGSLANGANSLADYKFWNVTGSCERAYTGMSEKFKFRGLTFNDFDKVIEGWNKK